MRIYYSGSPQSFEAAPEMLIEQRKPNVMLSFLDFYKKGKVKPPNRFLKHHQQSVKPKKS